MAPKYFNPTLHNNKFATYKTECMSDIHFLFQNSWNLGFDMKKEIGALNNIKKNTKLTVENVILLRKYSPIINPIPLKDLNTINVKKGIQDLEKICY